MSIYHWHCLELPVPNKEQLSMRPQRWGRSWYKSQSLKTQESGTLISEVRRRWMPQLRRKRENLPLLPLFIWFGPSSDRIRSTHIGAGGTSLFSLLIRMLISSRNTLSDIPRNNVVSTLWRFFNIVKQTHKINVTIPINQFGHQRSKTRRNRHTKD